jgi:hypothetical protein
LEPETTAITPEDEAEIAKAKEDQRLCAENRSWRLRLRATEKVLAEKDAEIAALKADNSHMAATLDSLASWLRVVIHGKVEQ